MKRLTFKAPRRCSVEHDKMWSTVQWNLRSVLMYIFLVGGYFMKGGHDFDCEGTATVATSPDTYKEVDYE